MNKYDNNGVNVRDRQNIEWGTRNGADIRVYLWPE